MATTHRRRPRPPTRARLENDEVGILRGLLEENVPVYSIVLDENELGDAGLASLPLGALVTRVSKLILRRQNLTDDGVAQLVKALRSAGRACTVTEIDLAGNAALTEKSGTALGAWALQQPQKVVVRLCQGTDLSLHRDFTKHRLKSVEMGFIAQLVASHCRLTTLNLQGNRVGHGALIALARALRFNTSIEQLNLKECDLTRNVWEALHRSLTQNRTLLHVDVRQNTRLLPVWTRVVGLEEDPEQTQDKGTVSFQCTHVRIRVNEQQHVAATRIQCMVRKSFARERGALLRRFALAHRSKKMVRAVRTLQNFYRRVQRERLVRVEKSCIAVQKHFRRFMAQKRFAALGIALVRSASIKTLHTMRLGRIEVVDCGFEACKGTYELMGTGTDEGTAKYVLSSSSNQDADFLIERSNRTWALRRVNRDGGEVATLYANSTITLFPPRQGWTAMLAETRELAPLPSLSLQSSSTSVEGAKSEEEAEIEAEVELLEQQCRNKASIRVVDAGSPEVNGLYVVAGVSNGVPMYVKRDATGRFMYTIRRVMYLGGKCLWTVARQLANKDSPSVEDIKVFYVSKAELDQPPDTSNPDADAGWSRGTHGSLPLPLFVLQNASEKQRMKRVLTSQISLASLGMSNVDPSALDKQMDRAARIIQSAYRRHMLLNIAKASYTLKELSQIVAVRLHECGLHEARGTYRCSRVSETSATGSSTLAYALESTSSDEWYIVERIRKGTMWAVLRAQGQGGLPDLIYVNKANGHSLVPPKLGWKATNSRYVASPRLTWVSQEDEEDEEDEDEEVPQEDSGEETEGAKGLDKSLTKKELRVAHRIKDRYKQAMVVTDAGSLVVHGRFEQHGVADGVAAFRSNRDATIQLRRVVHGSTRLWVIVRILSSSSDPNIVYYFNSAHGGADSPPLDDWLAHKGQDPAPLVVAQEACVRPH
ncbi:NACHT, LRR and PYD domains-containing protein 5 [Hondaea fermentalgiana]|uniref:NACHT, LRR and PYD domains-containing protein 5 n=1 Tax=Hondaea fermentalgiana TaxID=2315210 RepID=A0A2R5GB30_9STRA|nr:NACHT, LRR and PYD domains-containing protein 5 [Hondaea fermentalgiana]|eukprot:GBG25753.1 NACHT, LRR and PYD domains-containing protein 5 [Hondaea fermentalgiana]